MSRKKYNLPISEAEEIEINGLVFTVVGSDLVALDKAVKIMDDAQQILSETKENSTNIESAKKVTEVIKNMFSCINELLGENAIKKLAGQKNKKSLNLHETLDLLAIAIDAVQNKSSNEALKEYE